jgi:hypothetical protein
MAVPLTIQQALYCGPSSKESSMKLKVLRTAYALAALVAFVVASGAGSKFH